MSRPADRFHEGQEVFVTRNGKHTERGLVTKVGRTLVHVSQRGRVTAFRIDTGTINDNYGHSSVRTQEEMDAAEAESALRERLRATGYQITTKSGFGNVPADLIERVVPVIESYVKEQSQ